MTTGADRGVTKHRAILIGVVAVVVAVGILPAPAVLADPNPCVQFWPDQPTVEPSSRDVQPAGVEDHKVNVVLPSGYDELANRTRRYPVLYLLVGAGWSPDN